MTDVDESGHFLAVNISTSREGSDRTTVLVRGDHKFVNRDSVVRFDYSRKYHTSYFAQAGDLVKSYIPDVSEELHHRICEGFLKSPATPGDLKAYLQGRTGQTNS